MDDEFFYTKIVEMVMRGQFLTFFLVAMPEGERK